MDNQAAYSKRTVFLGFFLTATAGMVDIIGYLMLSRILPANMSGNTVEAALSATRGDRMGTVRRLWAVGFFVVGAILSSMLHEWTKERKLRRAASIALLTEVGLLVAWMACADAWAGELSGRSTVFGFQYFLTLTLATLSMGVQNASLTRFGPVNAFTTHVTGSITKLAESWAESVFWMKNQLCQPSGPRIGKVLREAGKVRSVQTLWIMSALWLAFFLGALGAAVLNPHWGTHTLVIPVAVLTAVAFWLDRRPANDG